MLGSESRQGLERCHRLLAPIMAKDEFIKIRLELIAAHAVMGDSRNGFGYAGRGACLYTTNCGLLKQPDKHEETRRKALAFAGDAPPVTLYMEIEWHFRRFFALG